MALLLDAICEVDKLVNHATQVDIKNEISVDFLNNLDERYYELRRNFVCRMCIVSMFFSQRKIFHFFLRSVKFDAKRCITLGNDATYEGRL